MSQGWERVIQVGACHDGWYTPGITEAAREPGCPSSQANALGRVGGWAGVVPGC